MGAMAVREHAPAQAPATASRHWGKVRFFDVLADESDDDVDVVSSSSLVMMMMKL